MQYRQIRENHFDDRKESPADPRQLITFALFAYNQEKYVREAVEGALAQTYSPLEIILSDDCSTDNTFLIMEETIRTYQGKHKVILRKNKVNKGLITHINIVVRLSRGNWIVIAAGDDVSLPERAHVVGDLDGRRYSAFTSEYATIAGNGITAVYHTKPRLSDRTIKLGDLTKNYQRAGNGATYAYRKDAIIGCLPLPRDILSEDRVLPFEAATHGSIKFCSTALVNKRDVPGSLSEAAHFIHQDGFSGNSKLRILWKAHDEILGRAMRQNRISLFAYYIYMRRLALQRRYWQASLQRLAGTNQDLVTSLRFWMYAVRVNGFISVMKGVLKRILCP